MLEKHPTGNNGNPKERSSTEASSDDRVQKFFALIAHKHDRTVTGRRCDDYEPRTWEDGDDTIVDCETCGIVLHRFEGGAA